MSHTPARNDPYQLVTDAILAHLDKGVVPWRCPWNRSTGRPRNFHTGREYQGVNVLLLGLLHFPSPWWMNYHLTLFHELIHSTGHASRLARKGVTETDGFGGKTYSQEELVAEMGVAFLGMEAGIVRDQHKQSAAYLKGWLDVLREPEHRRWIVQAANQAGRATDFILGRNTVDSFAAPAVEEAAEQPAVGKLVT